MLRLAKKQDREALLHLWSQCFGADQNYQNQLIAKDYPLRETWVLDIHNQVLAAVTVLPVGWQGRDGSSRQGAYLYGLGTLPQYRGKGHSHQLMEGVLAQLKEQGKDFALLCPAEESLWDFYAQQGFSPCGQVLEWAVAPEQQEQWLDLADEYCDKGWELEPLEDGEDYAALRHQLLTQDCQELLGEGFFDWGAEHCEWNHREAGTYGGGLCRIVAGDEPVAVAGFWPQEPKDPWQQEQGQVVVKELLCSPGQEEGCLALLAEFAGEKSLLLCMPSWQQRRYNEGTVETCGMIHWLSEERKLPLEESYLSLILD